MSAFMIDRKDYLNFSVQLHRFCNAPMPPHYTLELLRSLWRFPPADVTSTWAWRVDRLVRLMMLANRRAVWLASLSVGASARAQRTTPAWLDQTEFA